MSDVNNANQNNGLGVRGTWARREGYALTTDPKIIHKCYQAYKKAWCKQRHFSRLSVAMAFSRGKKYKGEMYSTEAEFITKEFEDVEYMTTLLRPDYSLFTQYIRYF